MPIEKQLKEIEEADLAALKTAGAREGKTIEFKMALNLSDQDAKRKFLASVASFANASGGDMIFGIRAVDGVAQEVVPLAGFNPDKDTLMLRDIIRSHIAPKIFGFDFKAVTVTGGFALVLRILKTWAGAHMVTFNEDNRFYVRDNNGKRSMDVGEVRAAFVGGEAITEKVRRYRQERISNILADETPVLLAAPARFVLHIVPLRSFEPGYSIDVKNAFESRADLRPMSSNGWGPGRDVDGFYNSFSGQDANWSYVHFANNGCIEAVEARLLFPHKPGEKIVPSIAFEQELRDAFEGYMRFLKRANVEPPFAVMLSMLNVRGYVMAVDFRYGGHGAHPINRDILLLPDVAIDSPDAKADVALKPIIDSVWNACGYWHSPHFTPEGIWKPR